jgi:hypothetical protein
VILQRYRRSGRPEADRQGILLALIAGITARRRGRNQALGSTNIDQLLQHLNLVQHIPVIGSPLAGIASPVPDGMELVDGAVPAVAKDVTFDIHLVVEYILVGNR